MDNPVDNLCTKSELRSGRALRRKRNLVAKNNRHRAKTHKSAKEYSRKEKYPLDAL